MSDGQPFWIYESGIGEHRAMLIDQGGCRQIRIERPEQCVRYGDVVDAKYLRQWVPGISGIAQLESGEQCLFQPLPPGCTEGESVRLQITRAAIQERHGQSKRGTARPVGPDTPVARGPNLLEQIETAEYPVQHVSAHDPDLFRDHGWHEVVEQAESGRAEFEGGALLVALTPAMTVIDVDGSLPVEELTRKAAREVALLLTRHDIGGSIAIDFPTIEPKAVRAEAVAVFDAHMDEDCERTAINGFGLMQVVRRKISPSVPEILQANRVKTAALHILRQAERTAGSGKLVLEVHPAVEAILRENVDWLELLAARSGRPLDIRARGELSIHGGEVSSG